MQSFRFWPFYKEAWLISMVRCRGNTGMPSEHNLPLNRVCDFWSILALVYSCEFWSTSVSSCPPLWVLVHFCEFRSTSVSSCPPFWVLVHLLEFWFISVSFGPFLWAPVHLCELPPPLWVLVYICELLSTFGSKSDSCSASPGPSALAVTKLSFTSTDLWGADDSIQVSIPRSHFLQSAAGTEAKPMIPCQQQLRKPSHSSVLPCHLELGIPLSLSCFSV